MNSDTKDDGVIKNTISNNDNQSFIVYSSDDRLPSRLHSRQDSRLSSNSMRYFDFLDTHHSVFSRNSYYDDKIAAHPWSRRPCSRNSGIPLETLRSTSCSPRLEELCRPKIKRERLIRQGFFSMLSFFFRFIAKFFCLEFFDNIRNYAYSGVPPNALKGSCTERLRRLAQPKPTPVGYMEGYALPRSVSEQTLNAKLSDRLSQLSKPRRNVLRFNSTWKNK